MTDCDFGPNDRPKQSRRRLGLTLFLAASISSAALAAPGDGHPVVFDPIAGGRSFVDTLHIEAGNLGLGAPAPEHRLVVTGDTAGTGRVAFGNDSEIGPGTSSFDEIFEFAHFATDFSGVDSWRLFKSLINLDPDVDLTGDNAKDIIGNALQLVVPVGNDQDLEFVYGGSIDAFHLGTGRAEFFAGAFIDAQIGDGDVGKQAGLNVSSIIALGGSTEENTGISVETGHFGSAGSIGDNYGVEIRRPHDQQPIASARGLFLEDHSDVATESWAIYSDGGRSYHAGPLGLGVADPKSSLQVAGYVHLDLTDGAPPSGDCDDPTEHGRLQVDATAGLLYLCVDSGWIAK